MATINAVHIHISDNNLTGQTYAILHLSDYTTDCNGEILLTLNLATEDEVDLAVEQLINEIQEAGKAAKRILVKAKRSTR